ncbi:MAG: sensor domain-containing diguanylate cyclase [Fibromonadaceae bacterium]|jgi:diguanylate cyclase (GGDEF)-like protein|nr:sensor domain-containing diguanylate cyclase [Fibromonadaceae bacterium]
MLHNKLTGRSQNSILRFVLLAFCMFFAIILIVLSTIYMTAQKKYNRKYYEVALRASTYTKSMQVNDYFKADLTLLQVMSSSPAVTAFMANPSDENTQNYFWKEFNSYKNLLGENRKIFFVNEAEKNFYFDTAYVYIIDEKKSDTYWYDSTLNRTNKYNFNVNHNPDLNETMIWINFPVFDNGKSVGMIGLGIDIDSFIEEIGKSKNKASYIIFNERGELLLHKNRDFIKNKSNINAVLSESLVDKFFELSKNDNEDSEENSEEDSEGEKYEEKSGLFFKDNNAYMISRLPIMSCYLLVSTKTRFAVGFGKLYFVFTALILSALLVFLIILYLFIKRIIDPLYYFNSLTQAILKEAPVHIAVFDGKGKTALISRYMSNLLSKGDFLKEFRDKKGFLDVSKEFKTHDGKNNYFRIVKTDIEQEAGGEGRGSIIYLSDVSEQMYLANTDSLTNIANKRYFNERANTEFFNSLRGKKPLAFLMVDIDHFKKFNDTFGHLAGDVVLKEIANTLDKMVIRRTDLVGRVGGEEFAIMLHDTNLEGATIVANKICAAIEKKDFYLKDFNTSVQITVSIGVYSNIPHPTEDFRIFLNEADKKLYEAKSSGRNMVCY